MDQLREARDWYEQEGVGLQVTGAHPVLLDAMRHYYYLLEIAEAAVNVEVEAEAVEDEWDFPIQVSDAIKRLRAALSPDKEEG